MNKYPSLPNLTTRRARLRKPTLVGRFFLEMFCATTRVYINPLSYRCPFRIEDTAGEVRFVYSSQLKAALAPNERIKLSNAIVHIP